MRTSYILAIVVVLAALIVFSCHKTRWPFAFAAARGSSAPRLSDTDWEKEAQRMADIYARMIWDDIRISKTCEYALVQAFRKKYGRDYTDDEARSIIDTCGNYYRNNQIKGIEAAGPIFKQCLYQNRQTACPETLGNCADICINGTTGELLKILPFPPI